MADNFSTGPADIHYLITPSDTADLPRRPRALRVLAGGNLALRDSEGTVITYAVTAGEILPFRASRVMQSGTTAIVAGWE